MSLEKLISLCHLSLSLRQIALEFELEAELLEPNFVEVVLFEVQQVVCSLNILLLQLEDLLLEILACNYRDALNELLGPVTGQPVVIEDGNLGHRFCHERGPVEVSQATSLLVLIFELTELEAAVSNKLLGIELLAVSGDVDTIASNLLGSTTPFPAF